MVPPVEKKDAPGVAPTVTPVNTYYYKLAFTDADKDWINAVTGYTLINLDNPSGLECSPTTGTWPKENEFYKSGDYYYLKTGSYALKTGENTLVIRADGYKDLTLKITKTSNGNAADTFKAEIVNNGGQGGGSDEPVVPPVEKKDAPADKPTVGVEYTSYNTLTFTEADKDWVKAITGYTLTNSENPDGLECSPTNSGWPNKGEFYKSESSYYLKTSSYALKVGENTLVIRAEGYKDLTLKITKISGGNAADIYEVEIVEDED